MPSQGTTRLRSWKKVFRDPGAIITLAVSLWLALEVPLWLHTMVVERHALDTEAMVNVARDIANEIEYHVPVYVNGFSYLPDLANATQIILDEYFRSMSLHWSLDIRYADCDEVPADFLCVDVNLGDVDALGIPEVGTRMAVRYSLDSLESGRVPELVTDLLVNHVFREEINGQLSNFADSMSSRVMPYSSRYHLTFSLVVEGGIPLEWNMESALDKLQPLLDDLGRHVANFTVDSQVEYYAKPGCNLSSRDSSESTRILGPDDLTTFVNQGEWRLASSIDYPTINFVLYVPSEPLTIADSHTNSFVVPQWGGVLIAGPAMDGLVDATAAVKVFSGQLLTLLGAPMEPKSLELRILSLSRRTSARALKGASASLGSLVRLTQTLPNIAIPAKVAANAKSALSHIMKAVKLLRTGDLPNAVRESGAAYDAAESAFFDKHMVAQVYFPDQHKLAIYAPFLGPLVVVTAGGWLRLLKMLRSKDEPEAEAEAESAQSDTSKKSVVEKEPVEGSAE